MEGNPKAKMTFLHYVDHRSRPCEKPAVRETAWSER